MKNYSFFVIALCFVFSAFFSNYQGVLAKENEGGDCAVAPVKDEYKKARSVFIGKVVKTTETADSKIFEFRIEKYWKGVKGKKIKVIVGNTMRFEPFYDPDKSYLIYAFADSKGNLRIYRCSRGSQIEFAKEDLKILGKAKILK